MKFFYLSILRLAQFFFGPYAITLPRSSPLQNSHVYTFFKFCSNFTKIDRSFYECPRFIFLFKGYSSWLLINHLLNSYWIFKRYKGDIVNQFELIVHAFVFFLLFSSEVYVKSKVHKIFFLKIIEKKIQTIVVYLFFLSLVVWVPNQFFYLKI